MKNNSHFLCNNGCHCALNKFGKIAECHERGCIMSRIDDGTISEPYKALEKIQESCNEKPTLNDVECEILILCNKTLKTINDESSN